MNITSQEFGVPGERDEEGFFGYHPIGQQHIFVGEEGFLLGLHLNATPQALLFYAGRVQGTDLLRLTNPEAHPFIQEAARAAYRLPEIEQLSIIGSISILPANS
ncbi:MAG: hypothetical protein H0T73_07295 [Ardenticatenales bacterium]|nr:hypothetical protein [Ardenticatenales bacterium]